MRDRPIALPPMTAGQAIIVILAGTACWGFLFFIAALLWRALVH